MASTNGATSNYTTNQERYSDASTDVFNGDSEVLDGAFADNVDTEMLGPFQDDEAAVEALTVRPLMYLPPKFVPDVLHL